MYDLFVYNFWYDFTVILGGFKLRRYVYILYDYPGISFSIPYRDLSGIVQKTHSHRVIQKSYDAHAMVLLIPYDYLESL